MPLGCPSYCYILVSLIKHNARVSVLVGIPQCFELFMHKMKLFRCEDSRLAKGGNRQEVMLADPIGGTEWSHSRDVTAHRVREST